jgi:hypothetical protein
MLLQNLEIEPSELPQIEEVKFNALEKDYLWMRLLGWGIFFLVSAGILTFVMISAKIVFYLLFGPWLLLLLVIFFIEIRGFNIKGYALREKDITYKSGLLFFHMTSVPFNRIQHCEVSQGPLARLFDLASVKVYTAGGSSSDLSISGLTKERAQKLRDFITKLSSEYE